MKIWLSLISLTWVWIIVYVYMCVCASEWMKIPWKGQFASSVVKWWWVWCHFLGQQCCLASKMVSHRPPLFIAHNVNTTGGLYFSSAVECDCKRKSYTNPFPYLLSSLVAANTLLLLPQNRYLDSLRITFTLWLLYTWVLLYFRFVRMCNIMNWGIFRRQCVNVEQSKISKIWLKYRLQNENCYKAMFDVTVILCTFSCSITCIQYEYTFIYILNIKMCKYSTYFQLSEIL